MELQLKSDQCIELGLERLSLIQAKEEDGGLGLNTAKALLNAGRSDDALSLYLDIWRNYSSAEALEPLSELLSDRDRFEELHTVLSEALELGCSESTRLLGNYYADTGEESQATAMFSAATKRGDNLAWVELGKHLNEIGKPEEAEPCFLRAIELGIDEANWSYSLYLLGQHRPDEAMKASVQALRDGWTGALVPFAQAAAELNNSELAEAAFLDAVDEGCPDAEIAYLQYLAMAHRVKDVETFLNLWREELSPDEIVLVREILDRPT